jgi:hypothetical protein
MTRTAGETNATGAMGRPHTEHAPDFSLPSRFIVTGLGFGVLGLLLVSQDARGILVGSPAVPVTLATVHTLTLGFFSLIMMGALSQWLPVLTATALYSARLARWQFGMLVAGLLGFIPGLASGNPVLLAPGGTLVLAGIGLFLVNLGRTLGGAERPWPAPVWFVVAALGFLAAAAVLGGVMAMSLAGVRVPGLDPIQVLPLHITFALGGWLGFTLMGVSWRLFPLFWSVKPNPGPIRAAWGLAMASILAAAVGAVTYWPLPLTLLVAGLSVATVAVYLGALGAYWTHRSTARTPDGPLLLMAAAPVALAMGLAAGSAQWAAGHWLPGLLAVLLGWMFLSIVGYVQRILPFMAWLARHREDRRAPHMPQLWPTRWSTWISGLAAAGYSGIWLGTLTGAVSVYRVGALAEAGTLVGLLAGIGHMMRRIRAGPPGSHPLHVPP